MHTRSLVIGLGGGLAFVAHALIDNSHAWPLVWPALAGLLAVWTSGERARSSYGADLGRAALAGLVAAAVFVVGALLVLPRLGATAIGFHAIVFAGLLGLVAATVAGALAHPVTRRFAA